MYNFGKLNGVIDRITVGEKAFGGDLIPMGDSGTISVFQGELLHLIYCHPRAANYDIEAFKTSKVEFGYIGVKDTGLTMPVLRIGHHYLEVPFNLNAVPSSGYEGFCKSSNAAIVLQYVDSTTKKVEAIRCIYPKEELKAALMEVGLTTVEKNISEWQYRNWMHTFFEKYTPRDNFKRSRKIGYVKGGLTTQFLGCVNPYDIGRNG